MYIFSSWAFKDPAAWISVTRVKAYLEKKVLKASLNNFRNESAFAGNKY